ncbi:het-domain-containing [Trichoderma arundinaceum]|uniref:Het-domain-containing n=1 Tax=Trichoderma arundinaceum TaxID=490622 RepID=A0A395NU65_TRIAR|nr:het-domain-containing [Trichoderma arundinaceum]
MKLASKWLSICLKKHKRCARPVIGAIPSRLLDVSAGRVRLVETDQISGVDRRFVALSWCWGGKVPLKTTAETLKAHMDSVPWESLPPLFQDVIYAVRTLGLKYLWIDALCIIQGSTEDWEKEAAKMQGVYQNATVTIAADGTQNCLGRLFQHDHKRLANRTWSFDLLGPEKQDKGATVFVRLLREKDSRGWHRAQLPDADELYKDEDSGFLTSRSWCFQEQVLPPRTLHFASTEVAWECLEGTYCECRVLPEKGSSRISSKTDFDPDQWMVMVEEMTLRDITYQADRLPAIGGLAGRFPDHETYLAGLWKSKLIQHLAWKWGGSHDETAERISGCHVPTWSWASLTGPVRFKFEGLPTAKLLDFRCKPATKNPFGPVQEDSFIELKAWAVDVGIQNASAEESMSADRGFILDYEEKRLCSAWNFNDWDIGTDVEILDEVRLALESSLSQNESRALFVVIELGSKAVEYGGSTGLLLARAYADIDHATS